MVKPLAEGRGVLPLDALSALPPQHNTFSQGTLPAPLLISLRTLGRSYLARRAGGDAPNWQVYRTLAGAILLVEKVVSEVCDPDRILRPAAERDNCQGL